MKAITRVLAGGVAIVALAGAAPAAAQYYPGYGYGGPGQVQGQGYGYGGPGYGYGPGANSQAAISQCVGAVQQRLSGSYGGYGYNNGYNNGYGYGAPNGGYGNARVLGISRVEPRSDGGLTVRGVASSGRYAGYGYGSNGGQPPIDLTFRCRTDPRGFVRDVDINRAERNYDNGYAPYNSPYSNDYSQYGYRRY
jgi:hypothetical protein